MFRLWMEIMVSSISSSSDSFVQYMQKIATASKDANFYNVSKNQFSQEEIKEKNEIFFDKYQERLNRYPFKPNSKYSFAQAINNLYKSVLYGDNPLYSSAPIYDESYLTPKDIEMDENFPLNIDEEFDKFLEMRGCSNVEELQQLNKTIFSNMNTLKDCAKMSLYGTLKTAGYDDFNALDIAGKIINGSKVNSIVDYHITSSGNELDRLNAANTLIGEYEGDEIDAEGIMQLQKILDTFMKQIEKTIQESCKTQDDYIKGQEEIGWVDFNHYDDKYGDKYKTALTIKYEDLHTYFQNKANEISCAEVSNVSSVNVSV